MGLVNILFSFIASNSFGILFYLFFLGGGGGRIPGLTEFLERKKKATPRKAFYDFGDVL